ncbi:hypothetical protein [Brucella sp. 2280]|uniref:hypothetical protein n=1 Tax=Brucella sp. 2280 TaxID=2592625 RepID=UPI0012974CDA|nr:hypothetical protein [Brucella sp. 2280]QGA55878.1 hypothetical protein GHC20_01750 [Brucella sp. 2280]
MNRRRFLSFLGLAPVAAAVPAMALPRAEKPTAYGEAIGGVPLYDPRKDVSIEAWAEDIEQATGPHEATAIRIDMLENDLCNQMNWISESFRNISDELDRIGRA